MKKTIYLHSMLTLLCTLWGASAFFVQLPLWLHLPLGIAALIYIGASYGAAIAPQEAPVRQHLIGLLCVFSLWTLPVTAIYWFWQWSPLAAALIWTALCAWTLRHSPRFLKLQVSRPKILHFAGVGLLALELLLLVKLALKTTGDTMTSPWLVVGMLFFVIAFLLFCGLGLFLLRSKHYGWNALLLVGQYTLLLSVAYFIFAHGFGFDPFIHDAAIREILNNGAIEPKQPYYIGQYILTLLLHGITGLSPKTVSMLLVPAGAALCIPLLFLREKSTAMQRLAIWALPLLPLSFFIVTTPNNLALLCAFVIALLLAKKQWRLCLLLALLAIAIHPFIGLPLFFLVIASRLKKQNAFLFLLLAVAVAAIVPLAFIANAWRIGETVSLLPFWQHLNAFWALFQQPHYYLSDQAPLLWNILYGAKRLILPVVLLITFFGYKKQPRPLLAATTVGLLLSSFFLATSLTYTGVVGYEQQVYAGRHLTLALVLLIPLFFHGLEQIFSRLDTKRLAIVIPLISLLLLGSWYFTYPTRDPVSHYTGFAVRDADLMAVQFIDQLHEHTSEYAVLTNQSVSAAALKSFGFVQYMQTPEGPQYFYPIPTGGPLYPFFSKMVYQQPLRAWAVEAMDFMGVDTIYFVHTSYWAPAAELRDAAKKEATQWWELAGGRVWVFQYTR